MNLPSFQMGILSSLVSLDGRIYFILSPRLIFAIALALGASDLERYWLVVRIQKSPLYTIIDLFIYSFINIAKF